MNAYAHGAGCHGRAVRGAPVVVAFLVVAARGLAPAFGDQMSYPEGGVVISDGLVEPTPLPNDVAGADCPPYSEEAPPMQCMPAGPAVGCGPRWYIAADALMLWQGNATSMPLLVDQAGATALDVGTLRTQLSAGPRVSLIRFLGECDAIEANFFQVQPFNSTAQAAASGGPYSLVNAGGLASNDIASATAAGSGLIQSGEVNWRRNRCCSPITWIAGFRWVELDSQVKVNYAFANPTDWKSGSIDVQSGNNLFGGQAGVDVRLWNNGGNWRFNGIGKAGLFGNANAYQRSTAGLVTVGGDPLVISTLSANADQVAFFGEAGLNATYCLTNWLAWRVGYTVFWANGVAVAAQQFPLNDFNAGTAKINTDANVMLHGVNTGFEACW